LDHFHTKTKNGILLRELREELRGQSIQIDFHIEQIATVYHFTPGKEKAVLGIRS
jgi:hypothetical protein